MSARERKNKGRKGSNKNPNPRMTAKNCTVPKGCGNVNKQLCKNLKKSGPKLSPMLQKDKSEEEIKLAKAF